MVTLYCLQCIEESVGYYVSFKFESLKIVNVINNFSSPFYGFINKKTPVEKHSRSCYKILFVLF